MADAAVARVCFLPYFLVRPVVVRISSVQHRQERRVFNDAVLDLLRVLVNLVANARAVVTCCSQSHDKRLTPGACRCCQDVPQIAVGLRVELVENHSMTV